MQPTEPRCDRLDHARRGHRDEPSRRNDSLRPPRQRPFLSTEAAEESDSRRAAVARARVGLPRSTVSSESCWRWDRLSSGFRGALRQGYDALGRAYLQPIFRREQATPGPEQLNEDAFTYALALRVLTEANARNVLDVGTGLAAWPRALADCGFRVRAIDSYSKERYWGRRPFNRHFPVADDDITAPRESGVYDAVTCLNVMMAITDDEAALAGVGTFLRAGGLAVLSFPYNENTPIANAYDLPGSSYGQDFLFACRIYSRNDLARWLATQAWELIEQEWYELFSGEFWTVGRRTPPRRVATSDSHHFTTVVLRKRIAS